MADIIELVKLPKHDMIMALAIMLAVLSIPFAFYFWRFFNISHIERLLMGEEEYRKNNYVNIISMYALLVICNGVVLIDEQAFSMLVIFFVVFVSMYLLENWKNLISRFIKKIDKKKLWGNNNIKEQLVMCVIIVFCMLLIQILSCIWIAYKVPILLGVSVMENMFFFGKYGFVNIHKAKIKINYNGKPFYCYFVRNNRLVCGDEMDINKARNYSFFDLEELMKNQILFSEIDNEEKK